MASWTKEERKVIKSIVVENKTEDSYRLEIAVAQLQAEGQVQHTKLVIAQQIRNCKAWTVELASIEEDSDSILSSPEVLRHNEAFHTPSPRLTTRSMNMGDACVKEDEINQALESFKQALVKEEERMMALKRRCDTNQVTISAKKARIEAETREVEKSEEDVRRDTAELRNAVNRLH